MTNISLVIVVLSGVVLLAPFIAQTLRMPLAVVEILLGCGVGYFGILDDNIYIPLIAKTGFLFLMFLAGMEVNLKDFLKIESSLFKRAIGYYIILYSLSALIVLLGRLSCGIPYCFFRHDYGTHQGTWQR